MKTVIIWDSYGEDPIQFIVVDKDATHLDGVYINQYDGDESKMNELLHIAYKHDELGNYIGKAPRLDKFPIDAVKEGAAVIVAGFLP